MVAPSFEVKQKVLQLVVQRIVVEDHRITIEHVVPSGPIRLQPERHAPAGPTRACCNIFVLLTTWRVDRVLRLVVQHTEADFQRHLILRNSAIFQQPP
jgi:hypothetical protein